MSRFNIGRIAHDYRARYREEFCRLFARMDSLASVRDLCWDLFSTKELVMFMRRIEVARMLMAGMAQIEIVRKYGFSNDLVSGVHDRLTRNGRGFSLVETSMVAIDQELDLITSRENDSINPSKIEHLVRQYPRAFAAEHLSRGIEEAVPYMAAARKRKKDGKKS